MVIRLILIIIITSNYCFGQFYGARNEALAGSFATQDDIISASNNIAKLSTKKNLTIGFGAKNSMLLKELQQSMLVIGFPLKFGSVAIAMYNFGFNPYRETHFSIAYAIPLSPKFSIGLKLSYYLIYLKELNKDLSTLAPDLGLNYKVNKKLEFGLVLTKLSLNKSSDQNNGIWSSKVHTGIKYNLNEKLSMFLETAIGVRTKLSLVFGLEYKANPFLSILLGIKSLPSRFSMGFGINLKKLSIDIASSYQPFLGFSPSISLRFETLH